MQRGHSGVTWTPTIPGDYKNISNVRRQQPYGASWAETYATVSTAPASATPTPPATELSAASPADVMTYIAAAAIAIIIAIAIVGTLILRKK